MKKAIQKDMDFVHTLSDEKLDEFRSMPVRARLHWLEEANMFVNKAIGLKKRAQFDKRFEVCLLERQKKRT